MELSKAKVCELAHPDIGENFAADSRRVGSPHAEVVAIKRRFAIYDYNVAVVKRGGIWHRNYNALLPRAIWVHDNASVLRQGADVRDLRHHANWDPRRRRLAVVQHDRLHVAE
jgi:hypothetical protein